MVLKDKKAIITGGSRGIGRAIALEMAKNGADVAIIYAGNTEAAQEVATLTRNYGVRAECYQCDVSDFNLTKNVFKKILEDFSDVDILVNNAGITKDKLLLAMGEEDFDSVIDINLKGTFNMIKHACSHFIKKRSGRIINITSVAGLRGNIGQVNYSASKAGVIGITKSAAKELASRGITCNAIAPGFIETDMTDKIPENIKQQAIEAIPFKHMGKGQDVAALAVFLASDAAAYITGEVIKVDGGLCI